MNKRKYFGTDGVRGRANEWPMTPDFVLKFAQAIAAHFTRGDHRHSVVIGKDTRLSGYMIENALTAGFVSMGMDVMLVGPMPTPAIAMLTRSLRADVGVMISASHNPYTDNGIKLFDHLGNKLSDQQESEIERRLESALPLPSSFGKARRLEDAAGRYIEYVKSTLPRDFRLDGLKIVVDCAHGAAYKVAPRVLWELGAEIIPLGVAPNGTNINDQCGATAVALAQRTVLESKADLGIVLDGDADRLIMIDAEGGILDGDQLIALIATCWQKSGQLKNRCVVTTQMSNLGFERYLNSLGLDLVRTAVGDRYVTEAMQAHQSNLGGEQSGHIVLDDFVTTGDGLLSALHVLRAVQDVGLSRLAPVFEPVPQVLKSIRLNAHSALDHAQVMAVIAQAKDTLADQGSLLIRRSGTEPVVRVMAQGDDLSTLENVVDTVIETIQNVDQGPRAA